jgi:hypothetical protein
MIFSLHFFNNYNNSADHVARIFQSLTKKLNKYL